MRVHALVRIRSTAPGVLIGAPIALPSDEHRGDIDGAARERPHLGEALRIGAAPHAIALKGAGELRSGVFGRVHVDLGLGQPLARRDLGRRRHERRDRLRHALVLLHHVIGRDLRHLRGGPRLQGMRLVPFPVGALVVVIRAEECVEALRRMEHVVVGPARALIVLVVLPRRVELRELRVEFVVGGCRARRGAPFAVSNGSDGGPSNGRAHDRDRAEDVGPDEGGPGRDRRTRIVSHHHRDRAVAERVDEPDGISHHVEHAKRIGIGVVGIVPAGRAAVAALIGRDHVIPRRCQRQHHLAPAVGELREAVQEQHCRPARRLVARFQHVHGQAVDVARRFGSGCPAESSRCRTAEDSERRRALELPMLRLARASFRPPPPLTPSQGNRVAKGWIESSSR